MPRFNNRNCCWHNNKKICKTKAQTNLMKSKLRFIKICQMIRNKNPKHLKNQEEQHLWMYQAKCSFLQKETLLKERMNLIKYLKEATSLQLFLVSPQTKQS